MTRSRRLVIQALVVGVMGAVTMASAPKAEAKVLSQMCDTGTYCYPTCSEGLGDIDCTGCGAGVFPQCFYYAGCAITYCGYDS
jgi:hypothetical protein